MKTEQENNAQALPLPVRENSELFGPPLLLPGEDADGYEELRRQIFKAVAPADILEQLLVADVTDLSWTVLRWRRLKSSFLRKVGGEALRAFLQRFLAYDDYRANYKRSLTLELEQYLPSDKATELAHQCLDDEPGSFEEVKKVSEGEVEDHEVRIFARDERVEEFVQGLARRDSKMIAELETILDRKGTTIETIFADALVKEISAVERIDRLEAIAETRRNALLHEIERHRRSLGRILKQTLQDIEEASFETIQTPSIAGGASNV